MRSQRNGQAFYLHNRVETIDEAAEKLQQLCPELRFLVAHGQMARARARGADDLVPRGRRRRARLDDDHRVRPRHPAGEHADRRARRPARARASSTRSAGGSAGATCSPTRTSSIPDAHELTPEARARLATLADHTELGAGFAIAMRDLEIRGAGDLLGAEQSGHVAALGFELYVEMLHEAVAELSGERRRRRAAGSRRRAGRRVRPGGLHRSRGAEDRPPPPHRARRERGRAARAPRRDRGPVRARCPSRSRTCSRSRRRS